MPKNTETQVIEMYQRLFVEKQANNPIVYRCMKLPISEVMCLKASVVYLTEALNEAQNKNIDYECRKQALITREQLATVEGLTDSQKDQLLRFNFDRE